MIPRLADAKIIRVDKDKETLLVWYGGPAVKEYTLRGHKVAEHEVPDPARPNMPTFTQVKHLMRSLTAKVQTAGGL